MDPHKYDETRPRHWDAGCIVAFFSFTEYSMRTVIRCF